MALRRQRIFARLRLGASFTDIAREERVSEQRVQQIVTDATQRHKVDDPRLEGAQTLAAAAIAAGDLKAILVEDLENGHGPAPQATFSPRAPSRRFRLPNTA